VNVPILHHRPFQGAIANAQRVLEHILAVHPNGILSQETLDLFGRRIEVSDPQIRVGGEKTIRDSVQNLDKALLFLVEMLQGLGVVLVDLIRDEPIPAFGMHPCPQSKVCAGQTEGELQMEVFLEEIGAMCPGDEPAFHGMLAVTGAKHLGTGQHLPAGLLPCG